MKYIIRRIKNKIIRKCIPVLVIAYLIGLIYQNGLTIDDIVPQRDQDKVKEYIQEILPAGLSSFLDSEEQEVKTKAESVDKTAVKYIRTVDGDTLVVLLNNEETKIRLIGIDTPESVHPDEDKNTEAGKTASEYTKSLLEDYDILYLEFDEERTDKYDRTLAYVWLSENSDSILDMLNAKLVADDYAEPKAFPPNTKYKEIFESLND